mgnify:FL=1
MSSITKKKPIHITVDADLKNESEKLFNDLGLSMTTAITLFLKQSLNKQGIPFAITKPNSDTMQALHDSETMQNLHGPFTSIDDLFEDLNA